MKKKIDIIKVSLTLSFVCVFYLSGQEENFGFCQLTQSWQNIKIIDHKPTGYSKILIVTNRPFISEPNKGEFFPNDIAEFRNVTYIVASCNGTEWNFHIVPDFEEGMQEIDNGRDILLFTDGHGKSLPMVLSRAFQVQERYNVSLILFDWPSRNSNFNVSLARVRYCSDNFFNLLVHMKEYKETKMKEYQKFSILLHSLGNYFLTYLVVNGNHQYLNEKFVDNIIMNAPAIKSKRHGEVISRIAFHDRIYITWNKKDFVLKGAGFITAQRMLGNTIIDPASDIQYIDFTSVAEKEHTNFAGYHSFEYDNPGVFYFYNTAFHGDEVNLVDQQMFRPTPDHNFFYFATN